MRKLNPSAASQFAINWLDQEMKTLLSTESDSSRQSLITTLFTRQKKTLECLTLVQNDKPQKQPQRTLTDQEKWLQILLHPAANLILPIIILVLAMFKLNMLTVVVSVLALVRSVLAILLKPESQPADPQTLYPYVDSDQLANLLRDQRVAISIDVDSIMRHITTDTVKEQKDLCSDLITVYCSLYEAKVDAPDNDDLSYPLSVLTTCLHRSGYDVIHYLPENAALFEVINVDYPSQERTPAIRSRADGVIVKKGLYLNEAK